MPETDAATYKFHPFDLTKVWLKKDYPLIEVGVLELNKNPENYFAEVEQSAFNPTNIVPGIGFSPDKMLQEALHGGCTAVSAWRKPSSDPVNAPLSYHSFHRRGHEG